MTLRRIILICVLCSCNISAELITRDWLAEGDGLITYDSEGMKEWLDITVTKTMSFDDVTNELSSGGRFAGFRYATASDLISLWESVGIQLGTIPNPPPSNREKV